ncbi:phage tail protein [Thauera sp. 2A1]|uniref:phage tail protein n=1 Tax=Thauera sp. 2A1 TaxID=2570191 RepID=UPI0012917B3E|nr:phage tail protein [Thauera sp. 2A1]KAI5912936.1 phage tail protein [Thauera sp. 2A1]
MDANGLRFWLLGDDRHWPSRSHLAWHGACRALRLASERTLGAPVAGAAGIAASALERLPQAVDREGAVAWWDEVASAIVARSHLPDTAVTLSLGERPADFAAGYDDVLYVALSGRVLMHDLRGRWPDLVLTTPGFEPWRVAADPAGGAWLLERASGRIARLAGCMQAARPAADYAHTTFRPDPENPDAPHLLPCERVAWPIGERPQAMAVSADGRLALLSWSGDGDTALRVLDVELGLLGAPQSLAGVRFGYALDWLPDGRIAVRVPGRRDVPVFAPRLALEDGSGIDASIVLQPSGDIYPLAVDAEEAPFAHRLDDPPRYPVTGNRVEPLHRLSLANLARRGDAANFGGVGQDGGGVHLIDSGDQRTVWHRLHAEARVPASCGFIVWLAATAEPLPPADGDATAWHPHLVGEVPPLAPELVPGGRVPSGALPRAAWERLPSELPGHPGLGAWGAPEPGRAGLWTVLVQRHGRRVRSLVGRYLWVRVMLFGDGRDSPELAALRIYGSRFSYRDHYLPRLYRETEFGAAAEAGQPDVPATASAADFLERMLANPEGWLTALEDRVAGAHLLTDPAVAPEEALEWLAGWIGVAFDGALPVERRRAWLMHAAELARFHGTRRGLSLALDIATDGGVSGGELVVLEGFRMRRLMATLLGVDLAVEDDPLLPGLVISGNSIVGDTLVLGEAERAALLALFRDEVASDAERAAVLAFYDKLAYRVLVLVHQEVDAQDLGLIRRIVELESPAHVEVQVDTASWPLLVGIASLVGVDTYLGPPRPINAARADVSSLGNGDLVLGVGSLDARLSGAVAPIPDAVPRGRPVADAGRDFGAPFGESFVLDGSASSAAAGRRITEFRWRRVD